MLDSINAPDAAAAAARRREVATALIDDITNIVMAINNHVESIPAAVNAARLIADGGPESVLVDAELFQWYFRMLELLEAADTSSAWRHAGLLPNVLLVPLAEHCREHRSEAVLLLGKDEATAQIVFPQLSVAVCSSPGKAILTRDGQVLIDDEEFPWSALLQDCRIVQQEIEFRCDGSALRAAVTAHKDPLRAGHRSANFTLEPIAREQLEADTDLVNKVLSGLEFIRRVWSELYAETREVTRAFAMLEGEYFVGGSDFTYAGVTCLRMSSDWSRVAFADHIVHEAAHHSFFLGTELTPFVCNPELVCPSPIRTEPRPLLGTLHAVFVFGRLVEFFLRASRRQLEPHESGEIEARLHRHALGLIEGVRVLGKYAQFTQVGSDWYDSMVRYAIETQAVVQPASKVADRVGDDYDRHAAAASVQ